MKFAQFLNEAPSMIELERDEIYGVPSYSRVKDVFEVYDDGYDLYRRDVSDGYEYAVLNHDDKKVEYFSYVEDTRALGKKAHVQKFAYKSEDADSSIVQYVFFNYLLPEFKLMITDNHHTKGGRAMWNKIIKTGLNNSKYEVGYSNGKETSQFDKDKWELEFKKGYVNSSTFFYIKQK